MRIGIFNVCRVGIIRVFSFSVRRIRRGIRLRLGMKRWLLRGVLGWGVSEFLSSWRILVCLDVEGVVGYYVD